MHRASATNSASVVERVTNGCFLASQEMGEPGDGGAKEKGNETADAASRVGTHSIVGINVGGKKRVGGKMMGSTKAKAVRVGVFEITEDTLNGRPMSGARAM